MSEIPEIQHQFNWFPFEVTVSDAEGTRVLQYSIIDGLSTDYHDMDYPKEFATKGGLLASLEELVFFEVAISHEEHRTGFYSGLFGGGIEGEICRLGKQYSGLRPDDPNPSYHTRTLVLYSLDNYGHVILRAFELPLVLAQLIENSNDSYDGCSGTDTDEYYPNQDINFFKSRIYNLSAKTEDPLLSALKKQWEVAVDRQVQFSNDECDNHQLTVALMEKASSYFKGEIRTHTAEDLLTAGLIPGDGKVLVCPVIYQNLGSCWIYAEARSSFCYIGLGRLVRRAM